MKTPLKNSADYDQAPELTAELARGLKPLSELLAKKQSKPKLSKPKTVTQRSLHAA